MNTLHEAKNEDLFHLNRNFTVMEAAPLAGMSEAWFRRKIFEGKIPVIRIGRSVRISGQFLRSLLQEGWQEK